MKKAIIFVLIYSFQILSFQGMDTKISESYVKTFTVPKNGKMLISENKFQKFEGIYRFAPGNEMKIDENNKIISVTSSQPNGDFKAEKVSDEVAPPKEEKTIVLPLSKLKKFEGEYEFGPGNDMKISLEDGNLKAYLKGSRNIFCFRYPKKILF